MRYVIFTYQNKGNNTSGKQHNEMNNIANE